MHGVNMSFKALFEGLRNAMGSQHYKSASASYSLEEAVVMESQRKQFPLSRIRKTCHFVIELFTRPTCLFTLHKRCVDLS